MTNPNLEIERIDTDTITVGDYSQWRQNPVTQIFRIFIEKYIEDINNQIVEYPGISTKDLSTVNRLIGQRNAFRAILDWEITEDLHLSEDREDKEDAISYEYL